MAREKKKEVESESECSDDEPDLETTSDDDPEIADVSKVLLGIKGSHVLELVLHTNNAKFCRD